MKGRHLLEMRKLFKILEKNIKLLKSATNYTKNESVIFLAIFGCKNTINF